MARKDEAAMRQDVFEQHTFTIRTDEALGTQVIRDILPALMRLLERPGPRPQVREIVIVMERPVPLTRGK